MFDKKVPGEGYWALLPLLALVSFLLWFPSRSGKGSHTLSVGMDSVRPFGRRIETFCVVVCQWL